MKKLILPISFLVILIAGGFYVHLDQKQKGGSLFSFIGLSSNSLIGTFKCQNGLLEGNEVVLEEGDIIKVNAFGIVMAYQYELKNGYIFYKAGEGGTSVSSFKVKDNNTLIMGENFVYKRVDTK